MNLWPVEHFVLGFFQISTYMEKNGGHKCSTGQRFISIEVLLTKSILYWLWQLHPNTVIGSEVQNLLRHTTVCLYYLLRFFYWWNHFLQLHIVGLDCAIYKLGSIILCKSKPELRNMVKTYLVKKALLLYSLAIASLATEVRGRKMVPNQSNKGRNMRSNPTVSQWARTISRVS